MDGEDEKREGFDTRSSHASDGMASVTEQPLSVPIWQVADYAFESAQHYADVINERRFGQVYGRYGNPTLDQLADLLAGLEGASSAWVFSSGMGAVHAALMAVAGHGDRIVAAKTLYGGTYGLFTEGCARVGIDVTFADHTDADDIEKVADGAAAIFIETVANPTLEIADLEGIGALARGLGIPLVVDNTVPTPVFLNPIEFGATLVIHSTSKYIGGHHDLMGGAVMGAPQLVDEVRHLGIRYGTTASAFESWLTLRGAATLGLRMTRHAENAFVIAELLQDHPAVERVLYPGLASHPQHERAQKLLKGFGGMVAADFGSEKRAWSFLDACAVGRVGSSFGGVRTELTHPATTSHRQFSSEDREAAGISEGLVRISVGIESIDDLLGDFENALSAVTRGRE
jgi:cystathionine beta-lyase/cystathionine gamma-synthase